MLSLDIMKVKGNKKVATPAEYNYELFIINKVILILPILIQIEGK